MKSCIYEIKIGQYYYIGKDMLNKRKREHLNLLIKNKHYNKFMQNAFNKYQEFNFSILEEGDFSREELNQKEIETIKAYREKYSKENIMNLTDGGDGGKGHKKTPAQIEASRKFMTEQNPTRKISREDVLVIYSLIKKGETNTEIGEKFNLHSGYISQIRIGDKYPDLYKEHFKEPIVSSGRQKLSYEQFLDILNLKNNGLTNAEIGRKFNLDTSVICRLVNKKTYSTYWKRYLKCV